MLNRQSKIIFSILLVVSILLHAIAWWWVDVKELFKPDPLESTTVQVTLQQPPEPPQPNPLPKEKPAPKPQKNKQDKVEPVEQEQHLPMHNADTFSSSNNTDREVNKYKPDELVGEDSSDTLGEKAKEKKKEAIEDSKPEIKKKKQVVVNDQPKNKQQENKEPKPDKSDQLSETKSKQVFSENKSDKLKMQNLYLKRMMQQITEKLITPRKAVREGRGTIGIVLNGEGYLVNATITQSSGDFVLDLSVMEAIKRVHRYEVPDAIAVAEQYYTQLTIRYDHTIFDP